ncbi:PD-(D/E)XK motif protein [Brevibacterium sp. W7.2]|uniref:PD-(D/E)XK motif protein n=1 Tax=Brevibacterium sp. W7.2 TaxID=2823518 RepID=UPI001BA639B3|nr:PD-(D/E)XK motif protein [Brevibacterium sp. W7.2]
MSAGEYFERALKEGGALGWQQAQVLPVNGLSAPRRAWLGVDVDSLSVAYFEVDDPGEVSFSVSQVISVQTVEVNEAETRETVSTVKLTCLENRLREVFYVFIDETLSRLENCQSVVQVIRSSAEEWRSLLQVARGGLDVSTAAGIYGELVFLEDGCRQVGPEMLGCWQRTPQDVHDFVGNSARVEVKTSSFQSRAVVGIHGLRQMEPPVDGTLTLAVAEIGKHSGETLDAIVDRLLDLGVNADDLTEKLADSGFVRGMPGAADWKFEVIETRFWEITDESPVLRRSAVSGVVADAVSEVTYSLSLSALGDWSGEFDWHRLKEIRG